MVPFVELVVLPVLFVVEPVLLVDFVELVLEVVLLFVVLVVSLFVEDVDWVVPEVLSVDEVIPVEEVLLVDEVALVVDVLSVDAVEPVPFVELVEEVVPDVSVSQPVVVPLSMRVVPSMPVELSISVVELAVFTFSSADVVLVNAKIAIVAITHPEINKYFIFILYFFRG